MNWKTTLYRLTFPDGKVYIGVTDCPKQRWATRYKGSVVGEAIEKYGWENVTKEILIELEPSVVNDAKILKLEREFIALYGENSYNRTVWRGHYPEGRYNGKTVSWNGETKTYAQWGADPRVSVSGATIRNRIEMQGWLIEDALFVPPLSHTAGTPEERRKLFACYRERGKIGSRA